MNEKAANRDERQEKARAEQFRALGEFIQEFEQTCENLRRLFIFSFHRFGLSPQGQPLAGIAIQNQFITAIPLVTIVGAIFRHTVASELATKIFDDLERRFRELSEVRNRIVHGTWHIGWWSSDEDEDFSRMMGIHGSVSKKGLNHKIIDRIEEMNAHIAEAKDLKELSLAIMIAVVPVEGVALDSQFVTYEGHWYAARGRKSATRT